METADIVLAIANTGSRNDKLAILKRNADNAEFKEVMQFIYNPYCKTGISSAKLNKALSMGVSAGHCTYHSAIEYFKTHQTGTDADLYFAAQFVKQYEEDTAERWVAEAIVTQNLKIGVTSTSLNAAYGMDFIPKVGCMLGTLYGDVANRVTWPCIVTEKLDGIRRVAIKENGKVRLFSRSGHEDTGAIEIIKEIEEFLPDNFVYDGELLAAGSYSDNIAIRQATSSIANSGGIKKNLILNVFDMVPLTQFYIGMSNESALERKLHLAATLDDQNSVAMLDPDNWQARVVSQRCSENVAIDLPHVKAVPVLGYVHRFDEVQPIVEKIWARHGEGVMLNIASGTYEIKRSKKLLKVKYVEEKVLPVVDFIEGTGKYEGALGAIVVDYKGSKVGVGSGFTDAQRYEVWDNQEYYRGMYAEIDTFGESQNQAGFISLNCPIFKRFKEV